MGNHPDAIIIGTGVIGSAIAFEMAKAGWKTLSLDRNRQVGHGSTSGSSAVIRVNYSTFDGTALAWEGYHLWSDWKAHLGLPEGTELARFRQTGCLVMKTEANGYLSRQMDHSRRLGCPFEEWDARRIIERLPHYALDSYAPARRPDDPGFGEPNGGRIEGAVFWPKAGYVNDPALGAQNLAQAARAHGAEFRLGVEIVGILQENGSVKGVKLADGSELYSSVVINAAGPGSSKVNEMAGVLGDMTITTRPVRQEVVHLPSPPGVDFERDGLVVSDNDIGCYCRPEGGNNIVIGSEDPDCDGHYWLDSDTDFDRNFTDQWMTQAMRYAQRVPSLGIPSRMRGVVELYDAATDWIPIYDRSSLGGFYMACGTSGNQFKNAPVAGKMMAAIVAYCEAGHDQDRNPLQFRLDHIGQTVDTGFYSRKRPVNTESSFSVLG